MQNELKNEINIELAQLEVRPMYLSKREWLVKPEITVTNGLLKAAGGNSIVAHALVRRGISDVIKVRAFLNADLYQPAPPMTMPGMGEAVDRLQNAILSDELICIWGDFDVDGQTATSLLYSALLGLGARVFYHIPVRSRESHGVNLEVLQQILQPELITGGDPRWPSGLWSAPDLLITCDTGISSHEATAFALACGVDVIITDHHDLPERLPDSTAIVNPKLCPADHPLRDLPGVGVAYKFIEEVYRRTGRECDTEQYLDLVALGIVADVATQRGDTRYLLQRGLEKLRDAGRLGLRTLLEIADVNPANISEEHIGFMLAPRLNAMGRLADANIAVELLTTTDPGRALTIGYELERLNSRRRFLTDQVFRAALSQVEQDASLLDNPVLVLSHAAWPAGVIGIVAGRLVERFYKPVVLIATPEGEIGRGSGRSIQGVNISQAIAECRELLDGYGGHPMAAGLAIKPEHVEEFREMLSAAAVRAGEIPVSVLEIDNFVSLSEVDEVMVSDIEKLAPFGAGNPALVLASRGIRVKQVKHVGKEGEHLSIDVEDETWAEKSVIWWHGGGVAEGLPDGKFDLAYIVCSSTYRGKKEIQIELVDFRQIDEKSSLKSEKRAMDLVDWRHIEMPLANLIKVSEEVELLVWGEGEAEERLKKRGIIAHSRFEMKPAQNLAIWTTPPGIAEIREVLDKVETERIYLFAVDPQDVEFDNFVKKLSGLIKYAFLSYGGVLELDKLAALTAHRKVTVRKGIDWLVAMGILTIAKDGADQLIVQEGGVQDMEQVKRISNQLQELLDETNAFRAYYKRMQPDTITELNSAD